MNFTLIVKSHGQKVQRVATHSKRVFCRHLRSIKWQNGISCYLRVSYGRAFDVFGKKQTFWNAGVYKNQKDLMTAFEIFTET